MRDDTTVQMSQSMQRWAIKLNQRLHDAEIKRILAEDKAKKN